MVLGLKMFLKKLTQEQRIRLRAQRKESQLIRNRAKERSEGKYSKNIYSFFYKCKISVTGFAYVVNPPEIPRVAFGSSLDRVTLPLKGPCLTSFMRKHQGDAFMSPGPTARVDEKDYLEIKVNQGNLF